MGGALGLALGADEVVIEHQALSGPLKIMALMVGPMDGIYFAGETRALVYG